MIHPMMASSREHRRFRLARVCPCRCSAGCPANFATEAKCSEGFVKLDTLHGDTRCQLPHDPTDQLVIEAVVNIARGLGTRTVAEFVGDEPTVQLLRRLGVDYGQGYHLGMPGPIGDVLPGAAREGATGV
jgi:hypothetical protein